MKKNIGREVLFLKTDDITPRNGEGTFLRLRNGNIMFVYSRFSGQTWYDDCTADIAALFSSDEGETWSEPKILFRHDNASRNLMCPSLIRLHNGNSAIIFLRKSKEGINAVPYISVSEDEWETFSEPLRIINDDNNYYVAENDHATVLENGRIILPVNLHSALIDGEYKITEHGIKCIFASDDNGKTWNEIAQRQDTPFPEASETGLQETCVYQQKDGTLRAFSRTDLAFQFECFSYDNGNTWTSPAPNRFFSSPDSPLLMKRAGDFTLAVFNPIPNYTTRDADISWGRTPLVCAVSKNDGKTFHTIHTLENAPENGYCYPAIFDGGDYVLISYYHADNSGTPITATKIKKITYDELENWSVTYGNGFFGKGKGKKGKKIIVDKHFEFNGIQWFVPAAYVCPQGIVLDIFASVDNNKVKKFISDRAYCDYNDAKLTAADRLRFENENPLDINFRSSIKVNGRMCNSKTGCSICWFPQELLPDGEESSAESKKVMEYYELDKARTWSLHRISFPFRKSKNTEINTIELRMEQSEKDIFAFSMKNPSAGETIKFTHSV